VFLLGVPKIQKTKISWYLVGILFAFCVAAAFRFPLLDKRPMHGDEANQAYRTGQLLETGRYRYDPHEHHGPTLYYLTWIVLKVSSIRTFADTSEWHFRIVPVLFGLGLIPLSLLLVDGMGRKSVAWASLLTSVSPAMVYYSRYYIQETLLVFFSLGFIACGWRYYRSRTISWAIACGFFAGLMHATKETCVLSWAAAGVALGFVYVVDSLLRRKPVCAFPPYDVCLAVGVGLIVAVLTSAIFFSSFMTHPIGIWDSLRAYATYVQRGVSEGELHRHPWYYYFQILLFTKRTAGPWWSEAFPFVFSIIGIVFTHRSSRDENAAVFGRFLSYYAIVLALLYALIPYKTPWCLLSFWHAMALLAGIGIAECLENISLKPVRYGFFSLALCAILQLSVQSYKANFVYPADVRNPYVYAHTSTAVFRLTNRVTDIASLLASPKDLRINVIAENDDYWPLPWYFRGFPCVGYWHEVPPLPDADVVIVSTSLSETVEHHLQNSYHSEFHGLRPNALVKLYIRRELWEKFMAERV